MIIHKKREKKSLRRKLPLYVLSVVLLALIVGFGILELKVYLDNNKAFTVEVKAGPVEEQEKPMTVFVNMDKSWSSTEQGEQYRKAVQYEGTVQNNTNKKIKEWELTIYLPQKGKIDSAWNATYEVKSDKIVVTPLEYNQEILPQEQQTFGFVLYSADILDFEKFEIEGYLGTQRGDYPAFWIMLVISLVWIFSFVIYLWVYSIIRKLEKRHETDSQIILQTLETFARQIDAKEQYTQEHSCRVALYSEEIAKRHGMSIDEATKIRRIALLHDCGKVGVPDSVLSKRGPLNGGERELINSHAILGGNVLKDFTSIAGIQDGALYHHERFDGKGYPKGLKGKKIPLCARIIAIADAYDAMSSDRCYRKHLKKDEIIKELSENSGTQFDPVLVKYMIDMIHDGFTYNIHHYEEE